METFDIPTSFGPARAHLETPSDPLGLMVLGPGASGSLKGPDLALARESGAAHGIAVAVVEQPYTVAGRRMPPRGPQVDEAFVTAVAALRDRYPVGPLLTGGRSFGGRVACRTAPATGAAGVICLAFPLQPPGGRPSRQSELSAVDLPTLIVQGDRDPFGMPTPPALGELVVVRGDHSLKGDAAAIRAALDGWLAARMRAQ